MTDVRPMDAHPDSINVCVSNPSRRVSMKAPSAERTQLRVRFTRGYSMTIQGKSAHVHLHIHWHLLLQAERVVVHRHRASGCGNELWTVALDPQTSYGVLI